MRQKVHITIFLFQDPNFDFIMMYSMFILYYCLQYITLYRGLLLCPTASYHDSYWIICVTLFTEVFVNENVFRKCHFYKHMRLLLEGACCSMHHVLYSYIHVIFFNYINITFVRAY